MLYKHFSKRILKKDEEKNLLLSRNKKNKQNSLLLPSHSTEYIFNNRPATAKYIYNSKNSLKSRTSSALNSISTAKKPTSPTTIRSILTPGPSKIYKKLDMRDKIEKIIKEESRKIYFKQRINYGIHLSVEELRSRFMNPIPQNAYKRHLQRRIKEKLKLKSKTFFEHSKKEIKKAKKIDYNSHINDLISTNNKLIRNFGTFSINNEVNYSKKNYMLVNNYFEKAYKLNKRLSASIKKQLNDKKENPKDIEALYKKANSFSTKMTDKIYKTEKNNFKLNRENKLKEKSKVFDNIVIDELNSNLEKIRSVKDDTVSRNKINYVALTNKIFLSNLIKQMKIIYIKDPVMNILRGNNSKRIPDLRKEVSLYDEFEGLKNKYNDDITFSSYNKIKLYLPKFIKTKFKKTTNSKYGHFNDNYFGVPV
jgi:hypothetical protein